MTVKFSTRNLDGSTEQQTKEKLESVSETLDMMIRFRLLPDECLPGLRTAFFATQKALQAFDEVRPVQKPTWSPDGVA